MSRRTTNQTAELLTRIVLPQKFEAHGQNLRWIDDDGDCIHQFGTSMSATMCSLSEDELRSLVIELHELRERARMHAEKLGHERGRREIVNTVHELLGIDKLARAVDALGPI